jgi:hypothetical protein
MIPATVSTMNRRTIGIGFRIDQEEMLLKFMAQRAEA